ncbi:DNA gyrase subunit A [Candidatus Saccharibacteria bacterium RIFCSPHIGHO2_01_FULL_45_15]|nr:MAG: DNA gyrase subunit A [Candidatus Saccharibacteria bacterium RIFCSPHIGHO2_01_FULL_45_15]OGL27435.1 MAG: DNA gyrase subunit A [Candidatus Saccharibacteria bacterium RIFCSPHIGHO2_02_FULL_46_12]OGL32834.1 MAG: DNA gyrase subunit A [Candidatus Saccharibacteria bacterium RIFCSPHIGHO2_12_FULL_44_22]
MEESFLRYSMSVIIDRALPDVRDGLKPVHRRILYTMGEQGLRPGTKTNKSARIVGDVMGKYHPHGDSSIYEAMVRLAQDWVMRYKLVDGQGNFGSMDGDPAAANRYTEARLGRAGNELLVDLDKDTVDFRDNYDGSYQEPSVLPAKLPNLLLNGQVGIAVGMATNIPPHNLGELVDATIHQIDNPDTTTLDDLLQYVKGPDFPTGAVVYGGASMKQAYQTGRGSVTIRAVANIEETKKGRHQIIVTEMPFAVNKATLIEKIAELVKDKKLTTISDLRDESARGKIRVVIELKKDAYPKKVLNQLYKLTSLQTSFHFNMLALIDGIQPRILGLQEILKEFIKHRQVVVRRRTEFELRAAKARAHILEGYKIALDHIDEVIRIIRASKTSEEAQTSLIEKFGLSEIQAQAILAMQLRRLTGLERDKIESELAELLTLIGKLEAILADEKEILRIIKGELIEMKDKYDDPRRSQIINHELGKFSDEELIPEEDSVILLTTENYIKRTLLSEYRRQHRGGKGKRGMTTKEEDIIDQLVPSSTHDYLLFFTNKGRIFRLKAYEVPAASLAAKGVAAVNLLQLQPEEKITSIIRHEKDAKDDGFLFMATTKGTIKKTPLKDYANIRTNGLIAIKLDDGDELRWIQKTTGEHDVIISTSAGQAIRFNEKDARPMGRTARGVRGVRLRPNDQVVGMDIVDDDNRKLLVISQNGYGKATKVSNFPSHKRGGVGIKAAVVTAKTGPIIAVQTLEESASEVLMISNKGQAIRVALKDIPTLGRTTQGVRIMRMSEGDKVSSLGLMPEQQPDGELEETDSVEA